MCTRTISFRIVWTTGPAGSGGHGGVTDSVEEASLGTNASPANTDGDSDPKPLPAKHDKVLVTHTRTHTHTHAHRQLQCGGPTYTSIGQLVNGVYGGGGHNPSHKVCVCVCVCVCACVCVFTCVSFVRMFVEFCAFVTRYSWLENEL